MNKKQLQSTKELTAVHSVTGDIFHAEGTKKELYKARRNNKWYEKMYRRDMEQCDMDSDNTSSYYEYMKEYEG